MPSNCRQSLLGFLALCLISSASQSQSPDSNPTESPTPKLILLVAVDQFPAEYINRFRPVLEHGFDRLLTEGVVFTEAFHQHAETLTGPGHATLSTGRHPRNHGIIGNYWWDRDEKREVYCAEDENENDSPVRLLTTTLGDWLQETDPKSKVFGLSAKDRAAILMAGKGADGAFWYEDEEGLLNTSSYYGPEPAWVSDINTQQWTEQFFGRNWTPLPMDSARLPELGVEFLDEGSLPDRFPHSVGYATSAPDEDWFEAVYKTPWVDEWIGQVAQHLVEAEGLGEDDHPDLLALSFSSTDSVGHEFGPHSPEVLDTVRRVDRVLGDLLSFLEKKVGRDHLVVALSADHGVMPYPEVERRHGRTQAHRESADDIQCFQGLAQRLSREAGSRVSFDYDLYLSEQPAAGNEGLIQAAARELERCPTVARAWTREELRQPEPPEDPWGALYWASYHPERSGELLIQRKPFQLDEPIRGTTHHSPYEYDTHVPLIFWAPGLTAGSVDQPVATVDLAPTLAELSGVEPPTDIDGKSLLGLFPHP